MSRIRTVMNNLRLSSLTQRILPKSKYKMTIDKRYRQFRVLSSAAAMDKTETHLIETPATLNYITPHFRAEAEVEVPALREGEVYTIGWIQAVTAMRFFNAYPSGCSSWELQELNLGTANAVSDADGRRYPWYGVTTECKTVRGPCPPTTVKVSMNDNFSPTVSWAVPWPAGHDDPDSLQKVERDQSFQVWLAVKDEVNQAYRTLKSYKWRAIVNIAVDCGLQCGRRASLLEPRCQEQPEECYELAIPDTALAAPRANEAQKFVWRSDELEVVFEVCFTPSFCLMPCQWGHPALALRE